MLDERALNLLDFDRRHLVRAASRLLGSADAEDAVQDALGYRETDKEIEMTPA